MDTPPSLRLRTTHDWAVAVDGEHLARIRQDPAMFAPGGVQHLVLEVIAYAADEAEAGHGAGALSSSTVMARCRYPTEAEVPTPASMTMAAK